MSVWHRGEGLLTNIRRLAKNAEVLGVMTIGSALFVMQVRRTGQLYQAGRYEEALDSAARASQTVRKWQAGLATAMNASDDPEVQGILDDSPLVALAMQQLAGIHEKMGNYTEALPLMEAAVATLRRSSPDVNARAKAAAYLSEIYSGLGPAPG